MEIKGPKNYLNSKTNLSPNYNIHGNIPGILPNANIEPSINFELNGSKIDTKNIQVQNLTACIPGIKVNRFKVNIIPKRINSINDFGTSDTIQDTPELKTSIINKPNANLNVPNINVNAFNYNISGNVPGIKLETGNVNLSSGNVKLKNPNANLKSPNVNNVNSVDFNLADTIPGVKKGILNMNLLNTDLNVNASNVNVNSSNINDVKMGGNKNLSLGNVDIKESNVNANLPNYILSDDISDAKLETGNINLPKVDLKGLNVNEYNKFPTSE